MRISSNDEKEFLLKVFKIDGFSDSNAESLSASLTDADLRGISSHGIQRLAWYTSMIKDHIVVPKNEPEILNETPATLFVDANKNIGQIPGVFTTKRLIEKAKKTGVAIGVVKNSNHFGTAGFYARMASEQGLIGIALTNTRPLVVPTNALKAFLGSNAFAFSFPAEPHPFVFDGATSIVSSGKIQVLAKKNKPIPGEWAVDKNRHVVHDAEKVEDTLAKVAFSDHNDGGGVLTLGGLDEQNSNYKGFGNSLVVELLTGILAQGSISADTSKAGHHDFSQFFCIINPSFFGNVAELEKRAEWMFDRIRKIDKVPGTTIFIPGDREYKNFDQNKKRGVEIDDKTAQELRDIGSKLGVESPKAL